MTSSLSTAALCAAVLIAGATPVKAQIKLPNRFPFLNESGVLETDNTNGKGQIDFGGPFFQSLGTNGRSCFSCHRPDQAWSISAKATQFLFELTAGTDPIFRTVDGSNCDHNIDTSSVSRPTQGLQPAHEPWFDSGDDAGSRRRGL